MDDEAAERQAAGAELRRRVLAEGAYLPANLAAGRLADLIDHVGGFGLAVDVLLIDVRPPWLDDVLDPPDNPG